VNIKNF